MPINQTVADFAQYLLTDGKYPKTIDSYTGDVTGFLQWLNNNGTSFTGQLQRFFITTYKDYLIKNNYAINTINKKINSLQAFNQYLVDKGYCKEMVVNLGRDRVKLATGSEQQVDIFTETELERLLFHIQDNTKVSIRDKMIVYLLLYTGIRVSELVNIKISELDFIINNLKVIGKGGKYREVPLKAEVVEVIKEYLTTERKNNKHVHSEYLILSQRAGKLHRDTINRLLNRLGEQLNMDIYPHKFRHTLLSQLVGKGVPITTVSQIAGHSNMQTTATFYVNTSRQDKINASLSSGEILPSARVPGSTRITSKIVE